MENIIYMLCVGLLVVIGGINGLYLDICIHGCACKTDTIICEGLIPQHIPNNITRVVIQNSSQINKSSFSDKSWQNVQYLDIQLLSWIFILNGTFENTINLKHLGIHASKLTKIQPGGFLGLVTVLELDLSHCTRLSMFYIIREFNQTNILPRLKVLTIDRLNARKHGPDNNFDNEFFMSLRRRPITEIYARKLYVDTLDLSKIQILCSTLRLVDISDIFVNQDISIPSGITCQSLRILNAKGCRTPYPAGGSIIANVKMNITEVISQNVIKLLRNVTTFELNDLLDTETRIMHSEFYFNGFKLPIRNISLRNNVFRYLDFTLDTDLFLELEYLDLAGNGIQYFNPSIIRNVTQLKDFNLANNSLSIMLEKHTSIFRQLFMYITRLQRLDMSHNELTYIPNDMFINNTNISQVHLKGNKLIQLHEISSSSLHYIDIEQNDIEFLDSDSIRFLQTLVDISKTETISVNMLDNPFKCTCDSLQFLNWFKKCNIFVAKHDYTCQYHGKQNRITANVIHDLSNECGRPERVKRTIIVSIATSVTVLVVMYTFVMMCKRIIRRRYRKRTIDENRILFMENKHAYRFPVFLSYCNEDAEKVMEHVYEPLLQNIREIIENNRDLVGIGDRHFRPGYSIQAEILRCLEMSGVMIAVVSHAFCESSYCRNEIEHAYSMEMPIILLFIEEVNSECMTPFMKALFKKYTRISLKYINGQLRILPDWNTICESILELATAR